MKRQVQVTVAVVVLLSAIPEISRAQPPNVARDCPYTMLPRPNYSLTTDAGDDRQLTDGVYTAANPIWLRTTTVGWANAAPVTVVIDLGSVQPISAISYSTGAGTAGVEWPRSIFALVSDDGQRFFPVSDLADIAIGAPAPPASGYAAFRYTATSLNTHGRYVALIIDAHGPYVFSDEIEVLAGDPAGLGVPLAGESTTDLQDFFLKAHMRASIARRLTLDLRQTRAALAASAAPPPTVDQLSRELDAIQAGIAALVQPDPAAFTTVLPLNDLHARIFAVHGAISRANGLPPLGAWPANPWDFVRPFDKPPASPARDTVSIVAMNGETRAGAISVSSSIDRPLVVSVNIDGLAVPADAPDLQIFEVVWTDTRELIPVADALLPLDRSSPTFTLPAGMTRQIWLSFAPRSRAARTWRGSVRLAADGIESVSVPIELRVVPGTYPRRSALHLGGWDYSNAGNRNNTQPLVEQLRALGVDSPWATNAVMPPGRFDADGRLIEPPSTSEFDRWIANWPDASAYFVFVSARDSFGNVSSIESARFAAAIGQWITYWVQHAAGAGIGASQLTLLLVDEPHSPAQDARIVTWAGAIKAAQPAVRIWEDPTYTDVAALQPELLGAIDVLAIKTWLLIQQGPAFADFFRARTQQGQELALYGASGPARLNDPYTYQRLQAWMCADLGATSSFFWSFSDDAGGHSWNEYAAMKTAFSPLFLADGQVTTTRHAEAIREGVEDFEYIAMLRRRVLALANDNPNRPGLIEARAFLDNAVATVLNTAGATDLQWTSDKDRSAAERMRLAIETTLASLDDGGNGTAIGRAAPSITVSGGTVPYDGQRHPAVVEATGAYGVQIPGSFVVTYAPGGSVPPLYGGVYSVTAQFTSADPEYADARADTAITIVEPTTVSIAATPATAVFGSAVSFAARVAGVASIPSGTAQFAIDGQSIGGAVMLQDGVAGIMIESPAAGRHVVTADYPGSDGFAAAHATIDYEVERATPAITVEPVTVVYDGSAHPVTAIAIGLNGAPVAGWFTVEYMPGGASPPADPGTYAAAVTFHSTDPNYTDAAVATTVTITKSRHKSKGS